MAFLKKAKLEGLTPEEVADLAFNKIMASVSVCEQSTTKMRSKLEAAGFPAASIEDAIERSCRIGALDDVRYCEMLVRSAMSIGKGMRPVVSEIERLGVEPESLESYQEYMSLGRDWQVEQALAFLERHPPRSKDVYSGCQRKLVSRGYDYDIASEATRKYMQQM